MPEAMWGHLQWAAGDFLQSVCVLLAQAENGAAKPAVNPVIQFLTNPINLILLSAILFMLIVVKPQQRQLKQHQQALSQLKKNDRVITAAGVHGTVVQASAEEPTVTIRIDENTGARMTVNRESISKIINSETKE